MPEPVQIPCPSCFALNRVAPARAAHKPHCGRCKALLFGDHPPALDAASFSKYVEGSDLPVVVDFWAPWCGPCRTMAPHFAAAARTSTGKALFAKLDTESAPQVAARFGIRSIPTLIVFRGGREVARQSGAVSDKQIVHWLAPQLN
jgi:thioredoxin 2